MGIAVLAAFGLLALLTVAVACSESESGNKAAPGTGSSDFQAAAQGAVDSALLTLKDLPAGWSASAPESEAEIPDIELKGECADLDDEVVSPGEAASAQSGDFTGPEEQEVSSDASAFSDEGSAQEAIKTARSLLSRCSDELVTASEKLFRDLLEQEVGAGVVERLGVTFEELTAPNFGDDAVAYRLTVKVTVLGLPLEIKIDFLGIRVGRMLGGLSYLAVDTLNFAEEQGLARTLTEKLEEADASLP